MSWFLCQCIDGCSFSKGKDFRPSVPLDREWLTGVLSSLKATVSYFFSNWEINISSQTHLYEIETSSSPLQNFDVLTLMVLLTSNNQIFLSNDTPPTGKKGKTFFSLFGCDIYNSVSSFFTSHTGKVAMIRAWLQNEIQNHEYKRKQIHPDSTVPQFLLIYIEFFFSSWTCS